MFADIHHARLLRLDEPADWSEYQCTCTRTAHCEYIGKIDCTHFTYHLFCLLHFKYQAWMPE